MTELSAPNPTAEKFGYPGSLVREYEHWVVLVRPGQVTLGSLVLVCKDQAEAFSAISAAAFDQMGRVVGDIETCLSDLWSYGKINYLMLMMVDKDVHFHVIPRYDGPRGFGGQEFPDAGWPAFPDLANPVALGQDELKALAGHLQRHWPGP